MSAEERAPTKLRAQFKDLQMKMGAKGYHIEDEPLLFD